LSWQDEVDTALQAWIAAIGGRTSESWQRLGTARPGGEPGTYAVDIRGTDLTAVQTQNLRLAGPDVRSVLRGYTVMNAAIDGELLRVQVAEFAAASEPYVWRLSQPPTFLVTALRNGLAKLTDAGLANLLARGEVKGTPAVAIPPTLPPAQADAYRACLGRGLFLVWGPPGTGKTRVLQMAISDLIAARKRVLLVSSTNIAVDNALAGVVRGARHLAGDIVRVGPPRLREISDDPRVCLPLMVRAHLAQLEEQRRTISMALCEMNGRAEVLRGLEDSLAEFDVAAFEAAAALLGRPEHTAAETARALAECELNTARDLQMIQDCQTELAEAEALVAEAAPDRRLWAAIETAEAELAQVERAARQAEARAVVAGSSCASAEDEIAALHNPGGRVRWRDRSALRDAQRTLNVARSEFDRLRAASSTARAAVDAFRPDAEAHIATLAGRTTLGRDEVFRRERAASRSSAQLQDLNQSRLTALGQLKQLRTAHEAAREAEELVSACTQRGWPSMQGQAVVVRAEVAQDVAKRPELEERYSKLDEQYGKLARDAEGEIIRSARLVATTLARFRTTKAVLDGPYDVVLVDEVAAATLPEVLLAVGKASQCAVLLGDFMQLGSVIPQVLKDSDRSDVRRWLVTDAFRHCGITTPADALKHPSCLVLDTQHRFGPRVMQLANLVAYEGVLKLGGGIREHAEDDPEIVLIDTDGLGELVEVHRSGRRSGWWPAGLLLARALVELHAEKGETTGVVTPYGVQAESTLEALRDVERGGRPLAEVATAHRFQGREFPSLSSTPLNPKPATHCGSVRHRRYLAATRGGRRACACSTLPRLGCNIGST
jgi:hypothetical protein